MPALAAGPKYHYADPKLDDEIENIYHDLKFPNIVNGRASTMTITYVSASTISVSGTITASTATVSHLNVTTITGLPAVSGTILQAVEFTTGTASSSTSSTYATTLSSFSFTPISATSTIYVFFSHPFRAINTNLTAAVTCGVRLKRHSTVLRTWDQVSVVRTSPAIATAAFFQFQTTHFYKDSPGTTSPIWYSTEFNNNGTGSCLIDNIISGTQYSMMLVIEVKT